MEHTKGQALPWAIRNFVMKKYARHRVVPEIVLQAVEDDLKMKVDRYTKKKTKTSAVKLEEAANLLKKVVAVTNWVTVSSS